VEGEGKVTGHCVYSADIVRPGTLWGGYVRSPYPHARILRIDASRAKNLNGVSTVVTADEVSSRLVGLQLKDKPVYARDRVRYIGEKVVGVAAVNKEVLEEALGLIEVEYEELPAVFDPMEAIGPDAPLLHPDYPGYEGPFKEPSIKNVRSFQRFSKGNVEQGFSEADRIFENTFRTHPVHQAFIEPRAGMVEIDPQGKVSIWHCHQAPFLVRKYIAEHTDIPEEMVVVHPVATGGSFGGKLGYDDIISLHYLARAAGRPVKIVESYTELLQDSEPRHAAVVSLKIGVKKDGRFCAWDGKIYYNGGAYGARTPQNAFTGTTMLAGSYRTPHVRMEGYIVYTNQVPGGYFRAPGEVQSLFGVESQMDIMAEALGLDPAEFRLQNVLRDGDSQPSGRPLRDPRGKEVLEQLVKVSGLKKKSAGARRKSNLLSGRGIALGNHHIGPGESTAELFLEPQGTLRLVTGVRDVGVGAYTMHKQVAAEILGVEPEVVEVSIGGTDDATYDEGIRAQRGIHIEGRAVARAAHALVEELCKSAASTWKVDPALVKWEKGRARLTGSRGMDLDLRALGRTPRTAPLKGFGHCKDNASDIYCFYAAVADVEVDAETGQVRVPQIYFAIDVTGIINPIIHQGQIDGSVIQGLGYALMEHLAVEDGRVMTLNLGDYKIPTVQDTPRLITSLVKAEAGPGPFGTKAVAECGISIIAPAIANAIYNATGVRLKEVPLAAEKIRAGLDAARKKH
jgi:carbon-monoxide dehydrogenase large subunit